MLLINELTIANLQSGKFENQLPEFYKLRGIVENFPPWHYNESVFNHTIAVLNCEDLIIKQLSRKLRDYLRQRPFSDNTRQDLLHLAIVFHDIGKLETFVKTGETTSCKNHESVGAEKARQILQREFSLSNLEVERICQMIAEHGNFCAFSHRQSTFQEYERLKAQHPEIFWEMILLELADTQALPNSEEKNWMIEVYKKLLKEN